MGISRDSRHKRSATGAKRSYYRKKRYVTTAPHCSSSQDTNRFIAEHLKKAANQPTPVSAPNASTWSASVVVTANTVLYVSILGTSPGAQKASVGKSVLYLFPFIPQITSSYAQTLLPSPLSSRLMRRPSGSGSKHITGNHWGGGGSRRRMKRQR